MIMAPYIGGNVTKTTHNTHFLVARMIYALFCRENDLRTFFCKNNLRTLYGKFLRVEICHPKSSDFLGLR